LRIPNWVFVYRIFQFPYASCVMILVWNDAHNTPAGLSWVGIVIFFVISYYYLAHDALSYHFWAGPTNRR
jgi:hypothetical protein